jgi:hypothetical protein
MNVESCLRRPSSKKRQSSKIATLIDSFVRIKEEKIVDGKPTSVKGGYRELNGAIIAKCVRFSKNVNICSHTFLVLSNRSISPVYLSLFIMIKSVI